MHGQAAWMVDGTIYSGRSHAEIIPQLSEAHKNGDLRHGYVDLAGKFYDSIEELFDSMKEFMIVRHAETVYNVGETDNLDSDLTVRGYEQAIGLAHYLADSKEAEGFVGLVSPYYRTLHTAFIINTIANVPFRVFPLVAEYGAEWSRVPYDIEVKRHMDHFPMFDWSMYPEARTFRAESFNTFLDRMKQVLEFALPEKTLIVSHGAVVYTLIDLLTGGKTLDDGYGKVTNASVSLIRGNQPVYLFKQDWKGD